MSEIQITGFEMIEKLGAGGMASVWKARQISLDRIVAIKILSTRLAIDLDDVQRFQTEAQSAAKLKHPGIVQVYDANVEGGLYYFVMEYVAGYTVGDWIRRKGALSEKDTLLVAECVAAALDYAWNKEGIIHCDIKPDNVMIDSDGTVKVADLGLARTISIMSTESASDEIMGTPAYISPEQARGEPDLDCRADIYSLGAMLYHLVTGKLLFEGNPDDRIMKMQINDTVDDPLDINPKLSKPVCWLIEKMLAKDRSARESDWESVKTDIARVKRGHMPHGKLRKEGISTVRRSKKRTKTDYVPAIQTKEKEKNGPPVIKVLITAGLIAMTVLTVYWLNQLGKTPAQVEPPAVQHLPVVEIPEHPTDKNASEMYESAKKWAAKNPGKYDEAITRFRTVATQTKGTRYSLMAEDQIMKLVQARQEEIEKVLRNLKEKTAYFVEGQEFTHAASVYESYSGSLAEETRAKRMKIAKELRGRQESLEQSRRNLATEKLAEVLAGVVSELVVRGVVPARDIVAKAMANEDLAAKEDQLKTVKKLLDDATGVDNRILDSFKAQKGKEISVHLTSGTRKIIIDDIKNGKVVGSQKLTVGRAVVSIPPFGVNELASREKLLRMGADDLPGVALRKGLMALNSKAYSHARKYFAMIPPILADPLLACVEEEEHKQSSVEAEKAPPKKIPHVPIVLSPELAGIKGNLKAVLNLLLKKNSKLSEEKVRTYTDEDGKVHSLTIMSSDVDDIGPVAALTDLKSFSYVAPRESGSGKLKDISALRGLALESLTLQNCKVYDIRVLKYMPLKSLSLVNIRVKDLSTLKGTGIQSLNISNTRVFNFRFLKSMKLHYLNLSGTQFKNLDLLKGIPLESLYLRDTKVSDISPLKGMPITKLDLGGTAVVDFSSLRDMPLIELYMARSRLKDIGILNGKDLTCLDLSDTEVKDLWALGGMDLVYLNIENTGVSDLGPLKGIPLQQFRCRKIGTTDFTPVFGAPIRTLYIDKPIEQSLFIRSLQKLHNLNGIDLYSDAESPFRRHRPRF